MMGVKYVTRFRGGKYSRGGEVIHNWLRPIKIVALALRPMNNFG
jgi:hypothetical protein